MSLKAEIRVMPLQASGHQQSRGARGGTQSRPHGLRRNQPKDTSVLDFRPPELRENTFLFLKPPAMVFCCWRLSRRIPSLPPPSIQCPFHLLVEHAYGFWSLLSSCFCYNRTIRCSVMHWVALPPPSGLQENHDLQHLESLFLP